MNVLLDDPFALEMLLAHAAMRGSDRRIHKMLDPRSFSGIRYIFPLPNLAFETDIRQPEILDAKDTVHTSKRLVKLGAILHIACRQLRAERSQFLRGRLIHVAGEGTDLPSIGQKFSRDGSALLTGCPCHCNH